MQEPTERKKLRNQIQIDISKELQNYYQALSNTLIQSIIIPDIQARLKLGPSRFAIIIGIHHAETTNNRPATWENIQAVTPHIGDRRRKTNLYRLIKDGYIYKYTEHPEVQTWRTTEQGRVIIGQIKRLNKRLYDQYKVKLVNHQDKD